MDNYVIRSPKTKLEWELYYQFRWEQLREPWGMSKDSSLDSFEENSSHLFGWTSSHKVIASGRIHTISKTQAQIRYMAVEESFKRKGIGSKIVQELELIALELGLVEVVLNARENALEFYESLGYIAGDPYLSDTGIPHKRMKKELK
tara:strand:+ start:27925 stop:28365 length:441 start_codon:yes stop_codon:yes gene_type:complete